MQIRPILSALRHHRLATALIAVQIALAFAVLCNASSLIANRLAALRIPSGVDEAALASVQLTDYDPASAADVNARALAVLRGIPGVESVTQLNSVPFGSPHETYGVTTDAAGRHFGGVGELYVGGPGSLRALGVRLIAGRAPQPADFRPLAGALPKDAAIEITRAFARHLWPGADPLGRELWAGKSHFRVMGVLDTLVRPDPGNWPVDERDWAVFVPALPGPAFTGSYLIRAKPKDLPRIMRDGLAALARQMPEVVIDRDNSRAVGELRRNYFKSDIVPIAMFSGVIVAVLSVTALGIVGLASFWVAQRHKQIGIRRALGARRIDILHHFQTENFLIITFGIVPGIALALGIDLTLMKFYELPALPLLYFPIGALALWALGQLAVLHPALSAAAVPPVVATRSV